MTKAEIAKSLLIDTCDNCAHRIVESMNKPCNTWMWCLPTDDERNIVSCDRAPACRRCKHHERYIKYELKNAATICFDWTV